MSAPALETGTPSPAPLPADAEDDQRISPEVRWYCAMRGISLVGVTAPRWHTPEPNEVEGAIFDPDRVDRVLRVFSLLRHTQGKFAGRPLRPDPWQVAYVLAPVFGWVRLNDDGNYTRIIRKLYVEVPRKNGKTTLAGGLAVYLTCADNEAGAQVYAVASGRDQARYCFDPVRDLAKKSPALSPYVKPLRSRLVHEPSASYFAVASKVADLLMGANVHGAIIDELHVHADASLVETVETGVGSREQPLVVTITTADDGRQTTIYHRRRTYVEQLARGALTDETQYGVIWCATEDDDPFIEETWARANPGLGVSPSREFLRSAANEAKNSPADLAKFLRLHLGVRTRQAVKYVDLAAWDATAGTVEEELLAGRECYGGLDLASVEDITALCWIFPGQEAGEPMRFLWRFWLPGDRLRDMDRRTGGAATVWAREGFLTLTEGDVIDNDEIIGQVKADGNKFDVLSVAYDRWGANDVQRRLTDSGLSMVPVNQGFAGMSAPLKKLLELTLRRDLEHGGNPVMRWMVDNLAVRMDPAGNVKPDKDKSGDKIDGVSAACNALREWIDNEGPGESMYEDDDLEFG